MIMIILKEPFKTAWVNKNPFEEVEKITGEVYRSVATRRTLRFDFQSGSYYIKLHKGITYTEFFKNIFSFHIPVLGARNEYEAIEKLTSLGVDTMNCVAYGETGINPIKKTSFIITEDLSPSISLEDYCRDWSVNPPAYSVKKCLIEKLAWTVRTMHEGGVNHRDCYICHFLLQLPFNPSKDFKLSVIDLHRAQIRKEVPLRWRNKDLVALYYSVMSIGLTWRDYARFLKIYFRGKKLKEIIEVEKALFSTVQRKAEKIRERSVRKGL